MHMMSFHGLQKLTLLDYPGRVACTIFTGGCNFRCPFCQNRDLLACNMPGKIAGQEVLSFLEKRRGLLDGVCISGGEPLLQEHLEDVLQEIKAMGYAVKLDTNGSFPDYLQHLVQRGLVDYVAMDIKNSPARYPETTGTTGLYQSAVQKSVDFLLQGTVRYEFRTTVVKEFHGIEELNAIASWISGAQQYYLQSFVDGAHVLQSGLHGYSASEMEALRAMIAVQIPTVRLRGESSKE